MQSAKQASGSGNREAKGFLFLICLLLIPFLSQYMYRAFYYKPKQPDLSSIVNLTDTCDQQFSYNQKSYSNGIRDRKNQNFEHKKKVFEKENKSVAPIEINSADTTLFKSLPGIGEVYALRIIKYRKLLGGFVEIDQIKEVYGIKNELFIELKPYLTIDTKRVKKIPGDSLWYRPYAFYHPYLSKEFKAIIQAENRKTVYSALTFKEMVEKNHPKLALYIVWK